MTEHIPAWKRIGLQVKQDLESDPLSLTTHINSSTTTKQLKKIKQQKRKLQESNDKSDKKPPKRVKLPKSERNPPPEKDQLMYLKQFETDRDNWKFSKQKQNWILKHIKDIPAEYDSALKVYLDGLQGSSRNRIVEDFKKVCSSWNDKVKQIEDKIDEELRNPGILKKDEENPKDPQIAEDNAADYDYAVKCQGLIKLLTDEVFDLRGIIKENEEEDEEEEKEEKEVEKKVEDEDVPEKNTKEVSETPDNLLIEEVNVDNFTSKSKKAVIIDGFADDVAESVVEEKKLKKDKKDKKKDKKSKKSNKSVKFT